MDEQVNQPEQAQLFDSQHEQHGHDEQAPPRRRLGRGLNALLGGDHDEENPPVDQIDAPLNEIDVNSIDRNPFQPRTEFDQASLQELIDSIGQHGVLQPVLVRPQGSRFQLIAGERRWLASKKAGLTTIPARVLELEDQNVCEVALEENLKRKDLNVLEKAQAFQDYVNRFQCSIEDLARRISLDRSTVSNMLRLLELPEEVKKPLLSGRISAGHARALLPLEHDNRIAMCERVVRESLSVRKTEAAVKSMNQDQATIPFPGADAPQQQPDDDRTNHVKSLEDRLRDQLGAKVNIKLKSKESGQIVIHFGTNDEFEGLVRNLTRAAA